MAEVTLSIGGRNHMIVCREGEEARLLNLGAMIDERWPAARRAAGGVGSERAMLFAALMLADDLDERAPAVPGNENPIQLVALAERLERLADTLEKQPAEA